MAYINRPDELARLMQEHPDLPVIPVVSKGAVIFGMHNGNAFFVPTITDIKIEQYRVNYGGDDEIVFEEEDPGEGPWDGTAIVAYLTECE